jgi:hypothetical protein
VPSVVSVIPFFLLEWEKTGTTGPTDGHTGGDKHPNKSTGTTETTVVPIVLLECLSSPV